jgi:hypothetical protein
MGARRDLSADAVGEATQGGVGRMPTNLIRNANVGRRGALTRPRGIAGAIAVLRVGRAEVRLRLADSDTAARIWAALPILSTVETWGASIHFETPVESGRDRTAKINGMVGEVYFWAADDRILLAWGSTPISGPKEIRLPRPCNVWATVLDDPSVFAHVTPGEKVGLVAGAITKETRQG